MIDLPAAEDIAAAATAFDRDWGAVDEVLYDLCRCYPGHSDRRTLTAKVVLIDRAYSAGLQRQVDPDQGAQAITKIADFIVEHGSELDAFTDELALLREPLDAAAMATIVSLHGRFTTLLRPLTRDAMAPRSFAAKYLHFHNPAVPLYDSYVSSGLVRLVRWDSREIPFARPPGSDADYWDFCVRFLRLCEACRSVGLAVSVKSLDAYLWAAAGAK